MMALGYGTPMSTVRIDTDLIHNGELKTGFDKWYLREHQSGYVQIYHQKRMQSFHSGHSNKRPCVRKTQQLGEKDVKAVVKLLVDWLEQQENEDTQ